ncbi:MAG: efflux RND transporter periplasmic adaptor subunit [Candidatus Euphemobacter frigidus]|nr:efflux RND transporter periplasmic adaptor subunit [Candidatus Euphemobacter frigidus]
MRADNKMNSNIKRVPRTIARLGVFITVVLFSAGCAKKQAVPEMPPRPVKVATAVEKDAPLYIESFGNLVSPGDVNIVSQVTGQIKEVHFKEGDDVKKGQLLVLIDPREYQADLEKSRSALTADKVDSKLKDETFGRNKKLIGKKLISQQDYDTYETEASAARAQVKLAEADVHLAEINLGYCSIISPVDGVAGRRQVDPGNVVIANNGPTLVNIRTIDPLYLDFPLPERKLPWVKKYMAKSALKVRLDPAGDDGGPYYGELEMIENTVDPTTGSITLRATVQNKDRLLWPGQYATVYLRVQTQPNAVLVPGDAVQMGRTGPYIYVVTEDNKAELREEIEVGSDVGDGVIIDKGVKAGDRVVTYGQMGLSDGAKVQIVTEGEEKKGSESSGAAGEASKSK